MKLDIPIIAHTDFDLSKFDFSFKDIYLYDIESTAFEEYIRSLYPTDFDNNFNFVKDIKEDIHLDSQKLYAIIKKDFKSNFNQQEIFNVHKLLLIIFPSDIQIIRELHYAERGGVMQIDAMTGWDERITGEYPGEYLFLLDEHLEEVNEFIKLVFDRLLNTSYIGIATFHYLNSFDASHDHYKYIALCMVLESVIDGSTEVTYRLKRNIALLLGNSVYNSKNLFDNLNKVYKLRSKIVHGEEYEYSKIVSYLPYIRSLASRVIIELLLHNFKNNKDLNERITELGYGEKFTITEGYKEYKLDIIAFSNSNRKDI